MSLADVDINLTIQNNTNYPQRINIMGSPYNPLDTSNATTEYRWDITTALSSANTMILQYKGVNQTSFTNYQQSIQSNITSLLTALNALNIGYFTSYTSGGSTYVSTYNQNYVFGQLNVYNSTGSTPTALYDFYQSAYYANSNTSVADLSGNGNNATPTLGTGTGVPTTLGNGGGYYNSATLPYDLSIPSQSTGTQYALQLPTSFQFAGVQPYTLMAWFQSSGTTFGTDSFQGIVGAEGRNGVPIGYSFDIQYIGGVYSLTHQRWANSTNVQQNLYLNFGSTLPSFAANTWYFAMAGYDGSNMYLAAYVGGNLYTTQIANTYSLDASPLWNAFIGLRYNNFLNGLLGYVSIYNNFQGFSIFTNVYNSTKSRYGY